MRRSTTGCIALMTSLLGACGGGSDSPAQPPPVIINPDVSINNASVREGDNGTTQLSFTVSVSGTLPTGGQFADASVEYATNADTATENQDFESASGTLELPSGTTQAQINITILADSIEEPDETLTVTLSSPVNANIISATATGTITDDDAPVAEFGLDTRPGNTSCIAPTRPITGSAVQFIDAFPSAPDLSLPTKLLFEPVTDGRWFVLQKSGEIVTLDPANPAVTSEYLDLNDGRSVRTNSEGGLLGMAFHPDYPQTPEIFVSYTIDHTGPSMRSVISRLQLDNIDSPGPGTVEQVILEVDQDFDNHNGGDIAFGPDGLLYVGFGDGGSGNDPLARSQDNTRLLGAMLRLDVAGTGAGYTIPVDNPFAGNAQCGPSGNANNCPEIYAWGLRNPWRWAFDSSNGELWLADVGQSAREEVNIVSLGGNYGWRCREGSQSTANAADCDLNQLIDPVTEYGRDEGRSITGGQVYRGDDIPDLFGLYVYGDFASGNFWVARPDGQGGYTNESIAATPYGPTAMAIGPDDELYMVEISGTGTSRIRRMALTSGMSSDSIPDRLIDTGCVEDQSPTSVSNGLIPYDLNARFWSDGADKDRHIGLPDGQTVTIQPEGDFEFPNGTVIVKNFRLGGRLIETRHLMRHPDGVWAGYTYEWNAAQTEATRVRGGKVVEIQGQEWIYPSEAQCMQCHTAAAGFALGPEIAQLNREFQYPQTARNANQLATLEHINVFSAPLPDDVAQLDRLAEPEDTSNNLGDRARAYLHTNCAGCHQPNGPSPSDLDLRYSISLAQTNACDRAPQGADLGVIDARLIAPGDSASSLVATRMARRDVHGMPPVGSNVIDSEGVTLVSQWIDQLSDCN